MTAPLQDIDLKTPTQPFPEPPPPYSDYAPRQPYNPSTQQQNPYSPQSTQQSFSPIGFQPPSPQPYPTVGFHAAVTSPQTEYPPYPIGTGSYPGAGSYGHSNCPPNNNTAYIIRTAPVCATTNDCDRIRRRRRILFILAIVTSFLCISIILWVIFGVN
uniref:Uncharacterized protein n=1 Tax=Panagrolaimus sp. PS1159 TaxID=55785 RepID=A0AC35EX62_9BILA